MSLKLSNGGMFVLSKLEASGYTTISISSGIPRDSPSDFLQKNTLLIIALLILVAIFGYLVYANHPKGRRKHR